VLSTTKLHYTEETSQMNSENDDDENDTSAMESTEVKDCGIDEVLC
jgi:hypothetical protein